MPDTTERKRLLRERYSAIRSGGDEQAQRLADRAILERLLETPEYIYAPLVLTYCSVRREPDTLLLIVQALADGKAVACPCVEQGERQMTFRLITSLAQLVPGRFGLLEPPPTASRPEHHPSERCICIVPGLAFDADGGRLGYGGGYYDSFLPRFKGITVGLCRADMLAAEPLPMGEFDTPVDMLITPERVIYARRHSC